jgi:hypothetical protein
MLTQDPELDLPAPAAAREAPTRRRRTPSLRAILLAPSNAGAIDELLRAIEPLARSRPPSEIVLARVLSAGEGAESLAEASEQLLARREALIERGADARVAAFTTSSWAADLARLASTQEAQLLVLDAIPVGLDDALAGGRLGALLVEAVCDVALFVGGPGEGTPGGPVLVPFAGGEHDWAALELGAWLARALDAHLRLAGPAGAGPRGQDASRLLADASLVVQRLAGVPAEPGARRRGARRPGRARGGVRRSSSRGCPSAGGSRGSEPPAPRSPSACACHSSTSAAACARAASRRRNRARASPGRSRAEPDGLRELLDGGNSPHARARHERDVEPIRSAVRGQLEVVIEVDRLAVVEARAKAATRIRSRAQEEMLHSLPVDRVVDVPV